MLEKEWMEPFRKDKLQFAGAYILGTKNSSYRFLISAAGCSMILHKHFLSKLRLGEIEEDFALKLAAHGLAAVDGLEHWNRNGVSSTRGCPQREMRPEYFIIDLTKKCNFNCIYCFRDLNDHSTIQTETLLDICNFIDKTVTESGVKSINIQLWGGEPLLAMPQIRMVTDYFKGKAYRTGFDIETNASMLNTEIAKELYERRISVGVSIDGPSSLQNLQRSLVNGGHSSEAVIQGIHSLKEIYGQKIGGICVITKHNYRHLSEMIGYFANDLGLHSMKFNLVRDNPNAQISNLGLNKEETKWFARQLCSTLELYHTLGIHFSEGTVQTRWENLSRRSNNNCCTSAGCSGGRRILSFDKKGDIYPCEMMDYPEEKIGSIYEKKSLMEQIAFAAAKNSYYKERKKEECTQCPWRYFCRGGCGSRVYYMGCQESVDENECILNQTIYPYLVEKMLKRAEKRRE